jgi:heat shock protein HtpX
MDELLSEPTSIHHPDSFVRAQSIVRPLCQRHNIPEPRIVIAPESSPNAAMMDRLQGRDVLLLTTGILRILTDRELTAVIAHEVAHQDRWYTRLHHFTATLFAWTKPMAMWGTAFLTLGAIAPSTGYVMAAPVAIATTILTSLAVAFNMNLFSNYVSRHNEIKTDLRACAMTGDPEALISALRKLEPTSPAYQEALNRRARLGLLTHPSFEERARAIRRVFGTSDHTK